MNTENLLIVHPDSEEQIKILKAFLDALKIKFEIKRGDTYNQEFVEKILESREEAKNGKVTRIEKANLKEFLGI